MDRDPTALRLRAARLRGLAARLDAALVHRAPSLAGDDTWRGPAALRCHDEVRRIGLRLGDVADDLRAEAARLEHLAAWESGRR
jgi:hypothetical protein